MHGANARSRSSREESLRPLRRPPDDYVVSRYVDGRIASRYGDLSWIWTPYSATGRSSTLNFKYWRAAEEASTRRAEILSDIRWVMHLAIRRRGGHRLSYQTLLHYLKFLRELARFCEARGVSLCEVLSEGKLALRFARTCPGNLLRHMAAVVSVLGKLGTKEVGFEIIGKRDYTALRILSREWSTTLRQHPPLPTRMYAHVLEILISELAAFASIADKYLGLVRRCAREPMLGRSKSAQCATAKKLGIERNGWEPTMRELLELEGLTEYLTEHGLSLSTYGLSNGLSRAQIVARLTIQAFSGMRDEEVAMLKYDCLHTVHDRGMLHYILSGETSKGNHGKPKLTRWVTNMDGACAVDGAQRIARECRQLLREQGHEVEELSEFPLFPPIAYLGLGGRAPKGMTSRIGPAKFELDRSASLRERLQPVIEDADLKELEQIDLHRAWRVEEEFREGKPWRLTTHQLRRSLALYAQRSGLVSLPSLKRQLHHITEEMTRYYARGSAFAKDFMGKERSHFGWEWQKTQPVSAALSYIQNVLETDEVLFGAFGGWIEKRLKRREGPVVIDREDTVRRFQKGELAYRETILGGCTSTKTCNKLPMKWLNVGCITGCKSLVGHLSKLDRAIAVQTKLIRALDTSTVEYRGEKQILEVLVDARIRIRKRVGDEK